MKQDLPLNIVIPMAGRGSRFAAAGFQEPKPLIPVLGKPMIQLVVENLRPSQPHQFIFVCLQDHIEKFALRTRLPEFAGTNCKIVPVHEVTEGAACTVLLAESWINNPQPLMIANSDQWIRQNIDIYLQACLKNSRGGTIMTMKAHDAKWSFVGLGPDDSVQIVVEKKVISDEATVGVYNFSHGADFVRGARKMIAAEKRVQGEFYVAPVYNELISEGEKISYFNIGTLTEKMFGLGTPEDLQVFLQKFSTLPTRDQL